MSMDPSQIQAMLLQGLGPNQQQSQGRISPLAGGMQLAQKAMLAQALQRGRMMAQQKAANAMLPGTNAQIANDPPMQGQPAMDPNVLAQLQQTAQNPQIAPPGGVPPQ